MRYTGSSVPEQLVIPSEYDGKKVTGVGLLQLRTQEEWDKYDGVSFFGVSVDDGIIVGNTLKSVVLPEGIETIGNNSPFAYQSGITSVEFPSTLKNIGDWAFCCCTGLKSADLTGTALENCLWSSFAGCTSLSEMKFPSTLTTLGGISFAWCRSLKSVTFMGDAPMIQASASDGGDGAKWGDWAGRVYVDSDFDFESFDTQRSNPKYLTGITTYVSQGSTGWGTVSGTWQGNSIVYFGGDPIPELPPSASAAEVHAALEGSADAKLQANIADATVYGQYREWAMKIGAETVKGAANSWISFAVDSAALLEKVPEDSDLNIEEFKPAAAEGAFDFTVSVKDVTVGSEATDVNLKKVFGLGGTTQLGVEEFDPDKVALEFGTPVNGKLKFTASPKDKTAKSFFMKMKVK